MVNEMQDLGFDKNKYPYLMKYASRVKPAEREILGREKQIASIKAAFSRPELCNVILLAPAGSGKTATVQAAMKDDEKRCYLDVNISLMIADAGSQKLGAYLKMLFDETAKIVSDEGIEIVLFMDEFHKIIGVSEAAIEDLKPLLADSGTRGIRVLAATTLEEFNKYISANQPLVERLQRINIPEPDEKLTVAILRGMAERYGVLDQFVGDNLFKRIYEYTNRYIPANSQPRKSILVLDFMVGWHRYSGRTLDEHLLADVIQESEDVNIAFNVDGSSIKKKLDEKVIAQEYATSVVEARLQLCVADLNNKTKPMSTLLFTGSSGTGKTELTKQLANILFGDIRRLIRFDMTEYATDESVERFRDLLSTRVWEHPYSIIMLDEIEKAAPAVTKLLLQVLDDGRLTNRNNREVSFTNAYVVLTTNAGSEIYRTIAQYNVDDRGSGAKMQELDSLIRKSLINVDGGNKFPPEFLGRIDCVVPFQPLSANTMKQIVKMKLKELSDRVLEVHNVKVVMDAKLVQYLVEDRLSTDSDAGGARSVVSRIEKEVTTPLAKYINENPHVRYIGIRVRGDLKSDNKHQLKSKAYVEVGIYSKS